MRIYRGGITGSIVLEFRLHIYGINMDKFSFIDIVSTISRELKFRIGNTFLENVLWRRHVLLVFRMSLSSSGVNG